MVREYEILATDEPVVIAGRGGRLEAGTRLRLNAVHGQHLVSRGQAAEVLADGTLKRRRGRPRRAPAEAKAEAAEQAEAEKTEGGGPAEAE